MEAWFVFDHFSTFRLPGSETYWMLVEPNDDTRPGFYFALRVGNFSKEEEMLCSSEGFDRKGFDRRMKTSYRISKYIWCIIAVVYNECNGKTKVDKGSLLV